MDDGLRQALMAAAPTVTLHAAGAGIDLVRVQPGEFSMGSPESEEGHAPNEGPVRQVRITKAYYLSRFEITPAQYDAVMGATSSAEDAGNVPVSQIQYAEALEFCRRASSIAKVNVRLPTEAQWEYACRAGTQSRYYSGSSEADLARAGWYSGNSGGRAHIVGTKEPNAWGFHDMHGNVWEYCADFIDDYATMASADPVGPSNPRSGAMRGGGWMHGPRECRAATRLISDEMFGGGGIRIALNID